MELWGNDSAEKWPESGHWEMEGIDKDGNYSHACSDGEDCRHRPIIYEVIPTWVFDELGIVGEVTR